MLGFKSLYRLTLFPSNPPLQLSLLAVCGSDDSCGEGLRLVWRNVCLPLIYYSLHGGGLYSGSLSVIFSMTSFDLRPPPLWGGFDFDLGCLLGAVPPCLLEVGLHLKGKGCIAAKRCYNKQTHRFLRVFQRELTLHFLPQLPLLKVGQF